MLQSKKLVFNAYLLGIDFCSRIIIIPIILKRKTNVEKNIVKTFVFRLQYEAFFLVRISNCVQNIFDN